MKKIIIFLFSFLICTNIYALVSSVSEDDGSPDAYPWRIKFSNGAVTDNGDGTVSVSTGGSASAGGGNMEVQYADGTSLAGMSGMNWTNTSQLLKAVSSNVEI